jgi:hypothetical protein
MDDKMAIDEDFNKTENCNLDLQMLHETLLEWCAGKNLDPNSQDAQAFAKQLFCLFYVGVRERPSERAKSK